MDIPEKDDVIMDLKRELREIKEAARDVLECGFWALNNLGPGKQVELWERLKKAASQP